MTIEPESGSRTGSQRDVGTSTDWLTPFVFSDGDHTRRCKRKGRASKDFRKTEMLNRLKISGKRVLDVGCSEGVYSFYLAEKGATVVGIDIDRERIKRAEYARERLGIGAVTFRVASGIDAADVVKGFDVAIAYGFLHRISDPINFVLDLGRVANAVVLEWRAPALLPGASLGLALHNPFGYMEWKNIESFGKQQWSSDALYQPTSRYGLADFWRLCPSIVVSLLKRLDFEHFRLDVIKREYTALSWLGAASRLGRASVGGVTRNLSWPYSRRVHLVASRSDLSELIDFGRGERFEPAAWDGRFRHST